MADAPVDLAVIDIRLSVRSDGVAVRVLLTDLRKEGGPFAKTLDEALWPAMEDLQDRLRAEVDKLKLEESTAATVAHYVKAGAA